MEQTYTRIISKKGRRAPEGKYRVMLNDRSDDPALYFVSDHDTAEEAFKVAETLRGKHQNGIVQNSKDWVLYPWLDGHQLKTSEELLTAYGRQLQLERGMRPMSVDLIETKQSERIPGWKPGDRLVVFWSDIEEVTGAKAYCGD